MEWNQVSNNVKPGGNFVVLDLDPANWYHLRVTAHNNAGFSVAEYEFATLTVTGGKIMLLLGCFQVILTLIRLFSFILVFPLSLIIIIIRFIVGIIIS